MSEPRRVLFLLGPASLLWRELAQGFEQAGHQVFKLNFSLGDQLFWWRRGAQAYRGRRSRFKAFLSAYVRENQVSDILYYADRAFYHIVAQEVAREAGIRAISIENGYLRPDWITLERGGMGLFSHFPADPATVRALARTLPEPDLEISYRHGFAHEIFLEIAYSMATYFWRALYPFYRFDRYYDPLVEYLVAIPHMLGRRRRQREANALIEDLMAQKTPCFVVALQLQGDQQIRANSPYVHLREFIDEVLASFAAHAAPECTLVFKQHPHDNNREGWEGIIAARARHHGVSARVRFIDGGDLGKLLQHSRGCVLVNSTVGLFSLRLGCPTVVRGIAIYDMPGLTHQGGLDSFWRAPEPVDALLAVDFVKVLAACVQVKGSFFNAEGRQAAVREIVARISRDGVNQPGAFVEPLPRIAHARRLGMILDEAQPSEASES